MQQFLSIHYLRAVAAIMVVVMHLHSNADFMASNAEGVDWLRYGVDIFFIISGFVMVKSTQGLNISPADFFIRRCQRVVPIYWIATCAALTSINHEWLFKAASFLFIPMISPEDGTLQPLVPPGWSLNYEMFFYVAFAGTLWLRDNYRFWTLTALFGLLVLIGPLVPQTAITTFYTHPLLLEFLLGMAIAKFNLRAPAWTIPIGFAGLYFLEPYNLFRPLAAGLPASIIVMGALSIEGRLPKIRLFSFLGDASYSIYIFHLLAMKAPINLWQNLQLPIAAYIPTVLIFVLLVCGIIHLLLEKPILRYFAQRRNPQRPQVDAGLMLSDGVKEPALR